MISEFGTVYAVYSKGRDPAVVAAEKAEAEEESRRKRRKSRIPNRRNSRRSHLVRGSLTGFTDLLSASACYNRLGR